MTKEHVVQCLSHTGYFHLWLCILALKAGIKICFTGTKKLVPNIGWPVLCKYVITNFMKWMWLWLSAESISKHSLLRDKSPQQSLRPCCSLFLICISCHKGLSCRTTLQILYAVKPLKKFMWNSLCDPLLVWTETSFCIKMWHNVYS